MRRSKSPPLACLEQMRHTVLSRSLAVAFGSFLFCHAMGAYASTPLASTLVPADNSAGVAVPQLQLTFDQVVTTVNGKSIALRKLADNALVESIAVTDLNRVALSTSKVGSASVTTASITPTSPLVCGTGYFVQIDSGAFQNGAAQAYVGIADNSTWNFTTADCGGTGPSLPQVASYLPADNATGVAVSKLRLTFDQTVNAVVGKSISLRKSTDNSLVESISASDTSRIALSSSKLGQSTVTAVSITPTAALACGTSYYVQIDSGAFQNNSAGAFAGISDTSTWNFSTGAPGSIANTSPSSNATGVDGSANLQITYCGSLSGGVAGKNIVITRVSDNAVLETIAATDGSKVTFNQGTVTINPANTLSAGTSYYVTIEPGAFATAGAPVAGIADNSSWTFTTSGTASGSTAPKVNSLIPADNSGNASVNPNLQLAFDQTVTAVSGRFISLRKSSDGSLVESIEAGDTNRLSISNSKVGASNTSTSTVSATPSSRLACGTSYYVQIDAGAFQNSSGGAFAGIADSTTWNFNTVPGGFINSTSPANNTANFIGSGSLAVYFCESMTSAVAGKNISIKRRFDNSVVETIAATDSSKVSLANYSPGKITFRPSNVLAPGGSYYVTIDAGAFTNGVSVTSGISDSNAWTFSTRANDAPNPIEFNSQANVPFETVISSNTVTITGVSTPVPISIVGGSYSINGAAFTTSPGTVAPNDLVTVRLLSAQTPSTTTTATLSVGSISTTFSVYTRTAAPQVISLLPGDNSAGVSTSPILKMNFDQSVSTSSGKSIYIRKSSDNSLVESIASSDSSRVTITNSKNPSTFAYSSTVSATPAFSLACGSGYYVQVDFGTFQNNSGQPFAGISDNSTWNFTTIGAGAITGTVPSNNALKVVGSGGDLGLTFCSKVTGSVAGKNIVVRRKSDNSIVESIAATDTTKVSIILNAVLIKLTASLTVGSAYYVTVDAGAFTIGGTPSDAISGTSGWTFSMVADTTPTAVSFVAQSGVPTNAVMTSNVITVSGITVAVPISIVGGTYSINGGPFTASSGSVNPNDTVQVRVTASATAVTSTTATLTIGNLSTSFVASTGGVRVPDTPAMGTPLVSNGSAAIHFTPTASDGGSTITGYTVLCKPSGGPAISAVGNNSPVYVTGLSNGVSYDCTVTATNKVGTSAPSFAVSIVPLMPDKAMMQRLAAGTGYSLAADSTGKLSAWGDDSYWQDGDGRGVFSSKPQSVKGLTGVFKKLAAGNGYNLALKSDGSLWAWGRNDVGQLGDGTSVNRAAPVKIGSGYSAIATGYSYWNPGHSLGLKQDGSLWAWGQNSYGQLGDGTTTNRSTPVRIDGAFTAVTGGTSHSLGIKQDGSLWAWGGNGSGQLGDGTTNSRSSPVFVGQGYVAVSASGDHSLALKSDGTLWSWGANSSGQVGNGTTTDQRTPVQIGSGYAAVSTGNSTSLAVKADGTLWSWGSNDVGGLGDGTTLSRSTPGQIGTGFSTVSAGDWHSMALKLDGTLWGWGYNYAGQIGDSTDGTWRLVPTLVASGISEVAVGLRHTVAVGKTNGTVSAWGSNYYGALGDGDPIFHTTPISVDTGYTALSASKRHNLAVKADGSLWSWGWNEFFQLCDGSNVGKSRPAQIGSGFSAVAAGVYHSLAVKTDGSLWACGGNGSSQLGDTTTNDRSTFVQVDTNYSSVSAGDRHSLALKKDGSLWAWGDNWYGQLGDGTTLTRNKPVQIGVDTKYLAVVAGDFHTIALKSDGSLWSWGLNDRGQLGDGAGAYLRSTPQKIGDGFATVSAHGKQNLALKPDGSLWAWGQNDASQLGDGTTTDQVKPVQIGVGFVAASMGGDHSIAVRTDGTVWTWGANTNGQLGDGTLVNRAASVLVVNEAVDGPLDMRPEILQKAIPADKTPPFLIKVSAQSFSLNSALTYKAEDLNKTGSVYVVAYLPANSPLLTGTATASGQSASSARTKDTGCPAGTAGTVPAVLTRGGWKQTDCTTATLPVYTGPLDTANNTFGMYDASQFDQTKDTGLFCVGYAGASTTSAKGLIRSVVSGVDATLNICPPIQIGATPDTTAPSTPLNITATAAGPGQVKLSWNAATDAVGVVRYNIYRGTSTTPIAILDNVTSYTDNSPQASTAYTYSVMACDAAANCSAASTPVPTTTPAQPSVTLGAGWNLVGNGGSTAMSVPSLFGDASKIYSVWKWVPVGSTPNITYPNWAFYTPGQSDSGAAYAASKGYDTFTSIASGEGFWVNAKLPLSVPMTAPAWILSSVFAPGQSKALTPGWSLIATGEAQTASAFNKAIGSTPPADGVIPINLTSLWAWQNSAQRWYFYAPSLDLSGGLNTYLSENNYLDFGNISFAPTTGFWVNKP